MKTLKSFFLLFIGCIILIPSCTDQAGTEEKLSDCEMKPSQIFTPEMNGIRSAEFSISDTKSIEKVLFTSGEQLELIQSGCQYTKQEFRFTIPNFPNEGNPLPIIRKAADLFRFMGRIDPQVATFDDWGLTIENISTEMKLGSPMSLIPGIYAEVDKIESGDQLLLITTLTNYNPEEKK